MQQMHTAEIRRVEEALDQREEVTRLTQELAEGKSAEAVAVHILTRLNSSTSFDIG